MPHLNPPSVLRRFTRSDNRQQTICVVDPQPEDYLRWRPTAEAHGLRLKCLATAEQALRLARVERVDLWVVSTALPGLSAFELCSMLKNQSPRSAVYLVADEYSLEVERLAWRSRATLFVCKQAHIEWLSSWVAERARRRTSPRCLTNH